MKSKQLKMVVAALFTFALIYATAASAGPGWGQRGGGGYGCGNCDGPVAQLDEKQIEERDKFFDETQDLRKELITKKAELRAMMNQENADPKAVGQLSGEVFELQSSLQKKAREAGLPLSRAGNCNGPGISGGKGFGPGYGMMRGYGPGKRGGRYGGSWN